MSASPLNILAFNKTTELGLTILLEACLLQRNWMLYGFLSKGQKCSKREGKKESKLD